MKPSFIIIGGVKSASSSLYRYLNEHPHVLPCKTKEPGYFNSKKIHRLIWGYRKYINLFPRLNQKEAVGNWLDLGEDEHMHPSQFKKSIRPGVEYITGEATANTFVKADPRIIKLLLPKVKLILLIRDPAERFISHYNMLHRFHKEGRKGYDLGDIESFVDEEISKFKAGKETRILSQGIHMDKLPKWKKTFGDKLRLYKTSALQSHQAGATMKDIANYLGLAPHDFGEILKVKHNSTGRAVEKSAAYNKLADFYLDDSKELEKQFGINPMT